MHWIIIALSAPALSALGNYLDKFLLVNKDSSGGLGSITLFSSLFGLLVLPLAYSFDDISEISPIEALALIINGFVYVVALVAYLYAIREDDIVSVTPTLQTTPVFGYLLGYLVLGETLSETELAGCVVIVLCAIFLSMEIEGDVHLRFRLRSFSLAFFSAFLFALSGTIFKLFAIERGYWTTQFWEFTGISLAGLILYATKSQYRQSFLAVVKNGRMGVIGLMLLVECIMVGADLLLNYATILAPIALVYTFNTFQPAFVLGFAMAGHAMTPHFMERLGIIKKHIVYKAVAITVMILGVFIIHN